MRVAHGAVRLANLFAGERGAFRVATPREAYRVEGKKTMAYELVEDLGDVPAAIDDPSGARRDLVGHGARRATRPARRRQTFAGPIVIVTGGRALTYGSRKA